MIHLKAACGLMTVGFERAPNGTEVGFGADPDEQMGNKIQKMTRKEENKSGAHEDEWHKMRMGSSKEAEEGVGRMKGGCMCDELKTTCGVVYRERIFV